MTGEEIITRTAVIRLEEDGIVRVIAHPGAVETIEDAHNNIDAMEQVCQGQKRPTLVDITKVKSQERGAREYYTGPHTASFQSAVAVMINSPMSKLLGNFYLGFNKPEVPIKLFTSQADALVWLKGFLQ